MKLTVHDVDFLRKQYAAYLPIHLNFSIYMYLLTRSVLNYKMNYIWDRSKPEDINDKTQRRQQTANYMRLNQGTKHKDVLCWFQKHNPNP